MRIASCALIQIVVFHNNVRQHFGVLSHMHQHGADVSESSVHEITSALDQAEISVSLFIFLIFHLLLWVGPSTPGFRSLIDYSSKHQRQYSINKNSRFFLQPISRQGSIGVGHML